MGSRSLLEPGEDHTTDKGKDKTVATRHGSDSDDDDHDDDGNPFVAGAVYQPSPFLDDDDGWVSDGEGHPELTRISPCTFAKWAVGCAAESSNTIFRAVLAKIKELADLQQTMEALRAQNAALRTEVAGIRQEGEEMERAVDGAIEKALEVGRGIKWGLKLS
ncbi:hypothetical protein C8A05DRAFT_33874 [Staphylotrichum tortipilum]|uniref:Uncharacterized protein n=1 Tax=Staphylotrichum tortipilum TaxID=2831512 RepID=A0AAN6MLH9_9PEZI|nr:hypothetical protein C8A05DRAFT_33874 [Staphylotrichum longicolle]